MQTGAGWQLRHDPEVGGMIYRTQWLENFADLAQTLEHCHERLARTYPNCTIRLVTVQLLPRNPGEGEKHRAVWEVQD
jgi:hypothetical protein